MGHADWPQSRHRIGRGDFVIDHATMVQILTTRYQTALAAGEIILTEMKAQRRAKWAYSALAFVVGILIGVSV